MLDDRHPYAKLDNDVQQLWQPFGDELNIPLVGIEYYNLRDGRVGCLTNGFRYWQMFINHGLCPSQHEANLASAKDQIVIQSTEINTRLEGFEQQKLDRNIRLFAESGIPHRLGFLRRRGEWAEITNFACHFKGMNGLQHLLNQFNTLNAICSLLHELLEPFSNQVHQHMIRLPNFSTDHFDLMNAINKKSDRNKLIMLVKKIYRITDKEFACLQSTAHGLTAKEIAKQLDMSPRTVEIHLEHIKQKFNVPNKLALCEKYFRYFGVENNTGTHQ